MNVTTEMEKAMQSSHKMGYAEYCRKLDKRLDVEKRREREYEQCKHIQAEVNSKIHK